MLEEGTGVEVVYNNYNNIKYINNIYKYNNNNDNNNKYTPLHYHSPHFITWV